MALLLLAQPFLAQCSNFNLSAKVWLCRFEKREPNKISFMFLFFIYLALLSPAARKSSGNEHIYFPLPKFEIAAAAGKEKHKAAAAAAAAAPSKL